MVNSLFFFTLVLAIAGTLALGAALLLERIKSNLQGIPAFTAGALYFLAVITAAVGITLTVLARGR